jgi:hypothetical protein
VHLEQLGFVKEKEYLENKFPFKNVDALYFNKWSTVVKKTLSGKSHGVYKNKRPAPLRRRHV